MVDTCSEGPLIHMLVRAAQLTLVATATLIACATTQPSGDRLASSRAAIRAAESAGAENLPAAALHLQLAREQVELGEKLLRARDLNRAKFTLMRSEADAELALALAQEAPLRQRAKQATEEVQTYKQGNEAAQTRSP